MRRCVCLLPLLLAFGMVPLHAQDKDKDKKDKQGPVQISWHGQSFFTITSSQGTVIVTDPHLITEYGRLIGLKANIVTMSHNHSDHVQIKALENFDDKNLKIIRGLKGPGKAGDWNKVDEQIKDVHISTVGVYHDNMEGLKYGRNTVFIFEVDGWRIVHLGDLGHQLSPTQIRDIGPVDVLMIPVGGIWTLNGDEAKSVVAQLKPKEYIFPMHHATKIYSEPLTADEFLDGVDKKRIAVSDDNRITLNRDPQRPRPLIVQLNYWPKK